MPVCTRNGCRREFSESGDASEACTFHPGSAVGNTAKTDILTLKLIHCRYFTRGFKSWSCCSEVYKPVFEFDEFMKIPGCTQTERHTAEAPKVEAPKPSASANLTMTESGGQEVYSSGPSKAAAPPAVAAPAPRPTLVEEEDDLSIPVSAGTAVAFVSDEVNRIGDGEGTVCTYHPQSPIFHEGSKVRVCSAACSSINPGFQGYLCCKRRVLEFDEFMKIEGCKKGRHLFAVKDAKPETEQMTTVHVSIFAKKADKERSQVTFEENQISFDLYLPDSKRFAKAVPLFGPIDPAASSSSLNLKKQDNRSWTILERTTQGSRECTIGAKEIAR
ncbi:hypothetical protein B0H14DRAFT_2723887 [Mycena olivaceomarginata]|nr:hypothetical protein B0H14DRAFT_2723887 [Mycena olivaceomarginata]